MTRFSTRILAEFALDLKPADLPDSAREAAARCLLDLVAAAAAGFTSPAARATRRFGPGFFPAGPALVWFTGLKLHPAGAALVNASAASALDIDDGHRAAGGHPGASVIPAALAWAQALDSPAEDLLAALALGYEVAVRVSAARDMTNLDTFSTGRWCAFGAAAAAGRLRRVSPEILAQALGIAGIHSPLQSASAYSKVGHQVKEGIPWATLAGLAALDLAQSGFTGPLDILDNPAHYDSARIVADLGRSWAIEQAYFKPYSCCRWLHAAIDGLTGLMAQHGLKSEDIAAVEIQTFRRAMNLKNEPKPLTLESAQFSLPFCLAVAARLGREALLPLSPELLGRPDLAEWAGRVRLAHDPVLEAVFPAKAGARIVLETAGGRLERLVEHPLGDPANPLSWNGLLEKFRALTRGLLRPEAVDDLAGAVADVKSGHLSRLLAGLADIRIEEN